MPTHSEYRSWSIPERLAILETQVSEMKATQESIDQKLDTLIALRNKGAGVFWLITAVFSTGTIGVIAWIANSFRTH